MACYRGGHLAKNRDSWVNLQSGLWVLGDNMSLPGRVRPRLVATCWMERRSAVAAVAGAVVTET